MRRERVEGLAMLMYERKWKWYLLVSFMRCFGCMVLCKGHVKLSIPSTLAAGNRVYFNCTKRPLI